MIHHSNLQEQECDQPPSAKCAPWCHRFPQHLLGQEESNHFWSYNNGLTITCRKVDELPNEKLKLSGIQIVNGCQTSNTIYEAFKNETLKNDTFLLVKIIETENSDLIYKITEATNSQTAITMYNLKANETVHKNIETYLKEHAIYYERRVNFYKNKKVHPIIDIKKLFRVWSLSLPALSLSK